MLINNVLLYLLSPNQIGLVLQQQFELLYQLNVFTL